MTRIADTLIPRPSPTFFNGRIYEPKLDCHICGKPGQWRGRKYGQTEVLGEILCDRRNDRPNMIFDEWMNENEYNLD